MEGEHIVKLEKVQKIARNGLLDNDNDTILEVRSLLKVFPGTIALELSLIHI